MYQKMIVQSRSWWPVVSLPLLLLFVHSPPRHLEVFSACASVCDLPGGSVSHAGHPGVLPTSDQQAFGSECFLRALLDLASQVLDCHVVADVLVLSEGSSCRRDASGASTPRSISASTFHFVPSASTVSRRLHCSPGGLLRTDSHFSKPNFAPTTCSSDEASRPHQQPLIHLFVSMATCTSWSGINANTDSPNMHKGETYGMPGKYWNGVLPSGRTLNLESTKPAQRTANGMASDIAESCVPVFVSICV